MNIQRKVYRKALREDRQYYNPVISNSGGVTFLSTTGGYECLEYQESDSTCSITVSTGKYCFDPFFCAGYLFWVEGAGQQWSICAVREDEIGAVEPVEPITHWGRPLSLSGCTLADESDCVCDCGFLIWEERVGRSIRIRLSLIGDSIGEPIYVTDGSSNSYDPVCCLSGNRLYLAYTSFYRGNYVIFLEVRDLTGKLVTDPMQVSTESRACEYPSLHPRAEGGVWISYSLFPEDLFEEKYVKHHRRRAQHQFFGSWSELRAGVYDGQNLIGIVASSPERIGSTGGWLTSWIVYGSRGGGRSRILEDSTGRAHLLFRQFTDSHYPNISCMTLMDDHWTEPVVLSKHAHLELPLSVSLSGDKVCFAGSHDARVGNELLDSGNAVQIETSSFILPVNSLPDYRTREYYLSTAPTPSIAEPCLQEITVNGFHAIRGQTHTHSSLSVCVRMHDRDLHTNYRFMQDVMDCRFGGTTDHAYNQWAMENVVTRKTADYYYFPGEFVALQAYEWTGSRVKHRGGPFGHVNVLSFEEDGMVPFFTPLIPESDGSDLESLWNELEERQILTIPHHVQDNMHPYYWHFFNDRHLPAVEIFQDARGSGETADGPGLTNFIKSTEDHWVNSALQQGRRFGFIAGGDHMGLAIAGVLVKEVTRNSLYEAITARRCFATTGVAALVDFTCNGRAMGKSIPCDQADFVGEIETTGEIEAMEIIRDGTVYNRLNGGKKNISHRWSAARVRSGEYWYLRIILADGEIIWSSPIWLEEIGS
ncbi:MAG: DUF3604 domain-containing protein [Bacteroidetes bacterium]|nr:DUF3604 domain-containing protein [Bacteroidota bacterium]